MIYDFYQMHEGAPFRMSCQTWDGKVVDACPLLAKHIGDDIRYVVAAAQVMGYEARVRAGLLHEGYVLPTLLGVADKWWSPVLDDRQNRNVQP